MAGMAMGGVLLGRLPVPGAAVRPRTETAWIDAGIKRQLADVALNAARSKGASYVDVRIGRYLNQFIITREDKVLNIVDTESYGMGIRVIANGCWGFAAIDKLEPSLEGRFREALFFPHEGHVEPRRVLPQLHEKIAKAGGEIRFNSECEPDKLASDGGLVIDCRGIFARDAVKDVRGVKGEMIIVETDEVSLSRPVRVMHPRWPLYVIPREDHRFMIGATSIESEDNRVSVRSALELLSAAYALHPAFGEARIIEMGAGLRPALPDNLPRIAIYGNRINVNGLYRHGFLLAPALAELTVNYVTRGLIDNEVMQCS